MIDRSRLELFEEALRRRDTTRQALGHTVALRVDVDSPGGQLFAALEIGRLLRHETASVRVERGAACISACVFVLMGGIERYVAADARIGLHRPSFRDPRRETLVPAMAEQLGQYDGRLATDCR